MESLPRRLSSPARWFRRSWPMEDLRKCGSPHSTFEDSKIGTIAGDARLFGHTLAWPPRRAPGVSKRTARVPQRPVGHATEHHGVGVGAWRSCWHPRRVDLLRD
uniref:Uncharacterized protein n=1 Tax=Oryza barthii TaxID=65489 RepID=A0A0D3HSV3_9ORYZ